MTALPPERWPYELWLVALLGAGVVGLLWVLPVLPTSDGPSHVYSAAVGVRVAQGDPLFTSVFDVEGGLRANMATWSLLTTLGPLLGWGIAERVVATLASLLLFGSVTALVGRFGRGEGSVLFGAITGTWIAQSWFTWMGFYDFSLAMGLFFLLPLVLDGQSRHVRAIFLAAILALLYLTHLYGLAAAVGLLLFTGFWQMAGEEKLRWDLLGPGAAGLGVLVHELWRGALAGSGKRLFAGVDPGTAAVDLLTSKSLVSYNYASVVAGALLTALAVIGLVSLVARLRSGSREGLFEEVPSYQAFGAVALIASFFLPDFVGVGETHEGAFLRPRVQFTAVVLLLPGVPGSSKRLRGLVRVSSAALVLALIPHLVGVGRASTRVRADVAALDTILLEAGARPGDWTQNVQDDWREGALMIPTHAHFDDRVNLEREYVAADHYQAFRDVFRVSYRNRPPRFTLIRERGRPVITPVSRLAAGTQSFLIHSATVRPETRSARVTLSPVADASGIGVTKAQISGNL